MRLSRLFSKTSKTIPSDETAKNAQLLLRAGYLTKSMAGAYTFLPLGLKVLNKIETIVRAHMDAIGSQEMLMNNLQPRQWWDTVGSWDHDVNDALFHVPSLNLPGTEYALSSSNEENVTTTFAQFVSSYKDLPIYTPGSTQYPLSVYHIHTKFRDEIRPKAGLMRGREFRMKDMYDLHRTKDSQIAYFETVTQSYLKCFEEIGLDVKAVNASGGGFSDKFSREFQVVCEAGEDRLYMVSGTDLIYNEEVAPSKSPVILQDSEAAELVIHNLPGVVGVVALEKELGIPATKCTKTLLYMDTNQRLVVAVVRADREISEEKLRSLHKSKLRFATESEILSLTGSPLGYAGLYNLTVVGEHAVYVDTSCKDLVNFEAGGNKDGVHVTNLNWGRDIQAPPVFYDIKKVKQGDIHPETNLEYTVHKGAEVGNIFDLGTRYTDALGVRYTDENNVQQIPLMGCHGLGTSRVMGVLAEIYSDEKGLKWPRSVAPFRYHLVSYAGKQDTAVHIEQIHALSNKFYSVYSSEVLWDDRGCSMGEKLTDAELMGCPVTIILSTRNIQNGVAEARNRTTGETLTIPLEKLFDLDL